MSSLLKNHEAQQFRIRMQHCAAEAGLRLGSLSDTNATLGFDMGKGRSQTIGIFDIGDRLCFVAHVLPDFEGIENVPGFLSNNLLQANNESQLGYWTLSKNPNGSLNYMIDYTVPETAVVPELFHEIIQDILGRCESYYDFLDNL